jgi:UDP-2,4-diacetamido-2,4,6-trideoxy-beta-L-altropyranose hydrolase
LSEIETNEIRIDVVIGPSNPKKKEILNLIQKKPTMQYHFHVDDLHEKMAAADLGIGAGGTTTWERCCMGLPTLVATIAPNQETISEDLAKDGYIILMGKCSELTSEDIKDHLNCILKNKYLLSHISRNAMQLVDGEGAIRVVNYVMKPILHLREATYQDCQNLFVWRNNRETLKYSYSTKAIDRDTHEKWIKSVIEDKNRKLLICESGETSVGVLRYDLKKDSATISIYLVPGNYKKGFGAWIIKEGNSFIKRTFPMIKTIIAEVKHENIPSQMAFARAGFTNKCIILEKSLSEINEILTGNVN